jgi:hypothetical protein
MIQYTTKKNEIIYVYPSCIPKDICDKWIHVAQKEVSMYQYDQDVANEIFQTVKSYIGEYPFSTKGPRDKIVFGKRGVPIPEHVDDMSHGETYKVLIYLNDVQNGGTWFRDGDSYIEVEAGAGSVVIFDMRIYHKGNPNQEPKIKYTAGIRLLE